MSRRSRSARRKAGEDRRAEEALRWESSAGRSDFLKSLGLTDLNKKFKAGKGAKRHETKRDGKDMFLISSERTLRNYASSWSIFADWVAERCDTDDMERLKTLRDKEYWIYYANLYLRDCIERGLSANTQSSYKSAITKILEISSNDLIQTQQRTRASKTNNRLKDKDERLSDKKNAYWRKIVSMTGLRVQELRNITGDALRRGNDGNYYLHIEPRHRPKGGRERWAPVLADNVEDLDELIHLFRDAGKKRVFKVPSAVRPHKYRAEYAARLYRRVARDVTTIRDKHDRMWLRKDLAGVCLDRKACQRVSQALGHNRGEEFPKSYVYKLINQ